MSFLNYLVSVSDNSLQFIHIEVLCEPETRWAVALIAVNTKEAVLIPSNHSLASKAFASLVDGIGSDHSLPSLKLRAISISINAFHLLAETESVLGSPQKCEILGQVLHHVKLILS